MARFSPDNLPRPNRPRWQPLRAGLTDLFYYDQEEFWFRDGRLLLRGNNGTGKSKVLALTLPFLLDGQLTPARVEPDGDPGKRMEWNLLLGGRYPERLGYSWLEFGRLNEDGHAEFFTIGCGLRAVAGRGAPASWFFTTSRRVGVDLFLVGAGDFALNRERLAEALGDAGTLFDSAGRYRRAVDEKLFQLGEERYRALVDLLIQLRQPQLSKRPNERALSAALTQALPPLDPAVLQDVAEAFRSLEAERGELAGLAEALQAVDEFRRHYRGYAQIAARRRAAAVRRANYQVEKGAEELAAVQAERAEAVAVQQQGEERREAQSAALAEARSEERTLRESPEMRSAESLHQAGQLAEEKQALADGARRRAAQSEEDAERARGARLRAEEEASASRQAVMDGQSRLQAVATEAGIAESHRALSAPLQLPDGPDGAGERSALERGRKAAAELGRGRREQLAHLEELNREADACGGRLQEARHLLQERSAERDRLRDDVAAAETRREAEGQELLQAFHGFAAGLGELLLPEAATLAAELEEWVVTLEGENPVLRGVEQAYRRVSHSLAVESEQARSEERRLTEEAAILEQEQRQLEAGEHPRPPAHPARDSAGRRGRPGAPLWQLVDFRTEVPQTQRAGIEAALEGAGLLDAWVLPEGRLLGAEHLDAALQAEAPAGRNLGTLLQPAIDPDSQAAAVQSETVEAILQTIAWGEDAHPAWIAEDGRWRVGPLHGRWRKEQAAFLGHAARADARRRRLAEIAAALTNLQQVQADIVARIEGLAGRRQSLDRERAACPSDAALRAAHQQTAALVAQLQRQEERCTAAEDDVHGRQQELATACARRDEAAVDLRLPVGVEELRSVRAALDLYERELSGFWPTLSAHWRALEIWEAARGEDERLKERAAEVGELARESERAAREAAARRDVLRDTVGESVAALEKRLAEVEERIGLIGAEEQRLARELMALAGRIGSLAEKAVGLEAEQGRRDEERREAIRQLQAFAGVGLLAAAVPDLEAPSVDRDWAVDPAVRLARKVEQTLEQVDDSDSAWNRHQGRLQEHFTALQNALARHGHEAVAEQTDSGLVIWIMFQGRRLTPDELAQGVLAELEERRRILDEKERELLETHLISEVARQLQELISTAEAQVLQMNAELESRPTSTGMKLRFQWKPRAEGEGEEVPAGLVEARRRLLRQVADAWSPEDREAVGRFLQAQINRIRTSSEGGTLLEHLERALDYRLWHRFAVERWQDGQWRPASGPASGGERVLAVTLPLFAAASAHYGSAAPQAPRLVLLDEAFAGVDDDSRAKCLGLLTQFDLDVVMTSEREWGCYPDVSGLSILQLTRREGIDAVHITRWEWDGRARRRAEHVLPPLQVEASSEVETETDSLF